MFEQEPCVDHGVGKVCKIAHLKDQRLPRPARLGRHRRSQPGRGAVIKRADTRKSPRLFSAKVGAGLDRCGCAKKLSLGLHDIPVPVFAAFASCPPPPPAAPAAIRHGRLGSGMDDQSLAGRVKQSGRRYSAGMKDIIKQVERQEALAYIRHAIMLCDRLGEAIAACHLQLGVDVLEAGTGAADRAAFTQAGR